MKEVQQQMENLSDDYSVFSEQDSFSRIHWIISAQLVSPFLGTTLSDKRDAASQH